MMPHHYDIYKTEKDILFPMNLYGGNNIQHSFPPNSSKSTGDLKP